MKKLFKATLVCCLIMLVTGTAMAGDGAYITFVNQTSLRIKFGTSDVDYCWKSNVKDVQGEIAPFESTKPQYFERSRNVFNLCVDGEPEVKFKVEELNNSDKYFANVHIRSKDKGF